MKKALIALIFVVVSIFSLAAELPVIAVYGFESSAFQPNVVMGYTKILESALFDRDLFRIVDRQSLEKIFQEQKLSLSGTVDADKKIIELGKLAGASYIVIGSLDATPSGYIVGIRILDVNTGMIEFSDSRSVSNIANVDGEIRNMTNQVNLDVKNRIIKGNRVRVYEESAGEINKTTATGVAAAKPVQTTSYKTATLTVDKFKNWNTVMELDAPCGVPKLGFVRKDNQGKVIGNFGISLAMGVSWKNYLTPIEMKKFNIFYRIGTVGLVVPYYGTGADYVFDGGLFLGVALDMIMFIAPVPALSGGFYF